MFARLASKGDAVHSERAGGSVKHAGIFFERRLQQLDVIDAEWDPRAALGVVMAAGGYPDSYRKGDVIAGLPAAGAADTHVFHAGTLLRYDEAVVTNGGRVLCVTALGNSVAEAQQRAYAACARIDWDGAFYRRDIGHRAIARERGDSA